MSAQPRPEVWGLVLAAGASTRMGRQKLTLPLPNGIPLIQHVLENVAGAGLDGIMVVVNAGDDAVITAAQDGVGRWQCVRNPHPEQGMSSSLRLGVELMERSTAAALVVLLGDQPDVSGEVIRQIVAAFWASGKPLVQASYHGQPSHPVLFGRALFGELLNGVGDEGGRAVVQAHTAERVLVDIDGDVPVDLDTPAAYERWLAERS